jgi:prepilin-type N-terminal cleavage/methylation domain-containing protein/prepilin-type processing-associated H-X9-DG protein
MKNPKPNQGFTLVELLVVISIIALLLAVLMPSLNRAREQAKAVVCFSNLKQWSYSFAFYLNDNQNRFVRGYNFMDYKDANDFWPGALKKYQKDALKIRFCPAASAPARDARDAQLDASMCFGQTRKAWGIMPQDIYGWQKGDFGSFGENSFVSNPTKSWTQSGEAKFVRNPFVKNASQIPLFIDALWMQVGPGEWDKAPNNDSTSFEAAREAFSSNMGRVCINRHLGGVDALFLDGHVGKIGLKSLWQTRWNLTWDFSSAKPSNAWPAWMRNLK